MIRRWALFAVFAGLFAVLAWPSLAGEAPEVKPRELVMFWRKGCAFCAAWEREVGPAYQKSAEGKRYPLRRVEIDTEEAGIEVETPPRFTPTFVLALCGREAARVTGYIGPDQFWSLLDLALASAEKKAEAETC
jgi:thioredoxin-related protein